MTFARTRRGFLVLAMTTGAATCTAARAGTASEPLPVRAGSFDIAYTMNEASLPLDRVQLWYTIDRGQTWSAYGEDEDRQSPVSFAAPSEGLFGFFLLATNATGASSVAPTPGTAPHLWAYVDETPPIVQLHSVRATMHMGQPTLKIAWSAVDAHFAARPIVLSYRLAAEATWQTITPEPLANTGRFDWRIPSGLAGSVAIRVTARDRGEHRVHSAIQRVEIESITRKTDGTPSGDSQKNTGDAGRTARGATTPSKRDRAAQLLTEAIQYERRGEERAAIARLRESVRLNPNQTEAFARMADIFYRIGEKDRALSAYEIAIAQQPRMRTALRGAARIYGERQQHAKAAKRLRTILSANERDAEVWMNLGDVAVFQGDEILARSCYTRATQVDPSATDTIAEARTRLSLLTQVSRTLTARKP